MTPITLTTNVTEQGIVLHHGNQKVGLIKFGSLHTTWTFWPELHDPLNSRLVGMTLKSLSAAHYIALAYLEELFEAFKLDEKLNDFVEPTEWQVGQDMLVAGPVDKGGYEVTMWTEGGNSVHWSLNFELPQYAWTEIKRWVA